MNIVHLLKNRSEENPGKPAIIFKEQSIGFQSLKEFSFRLADSLHKLGLNKSDRVAVYLPNCPEYIYSYLASWCCGATCVPLDFMLTEDELASCISHCEAKILIARSKPNIDFELLRKNCPALKEIILCDEQISDDKKGFLSFEKLLREGQDESLGIKINDKDCAIIFYTSGTTGRPKGVLINYLQLDAPPKAIEYFVQDIQKTDVILSALPFSHLGGLIYVQLVLEFGLTGVLMERFHPSEFLRNIQTYKVNWFWLVPSMYYAFLQLKEFETFDLSSLRWLVIFGAPSSPDAMRRFHQHCPQANLFHGWGLTETNAPTTVIPTGSEKIESVGKPAPWIEINIVDDMDKDIPQGQIGEIVVKSWVVTDGYFRDPEATKQAIHNGWFHTGDLGRFDRDSFLYIVGRKKEMIKVGGEIVFEPEVEAALHKHPQVAEAAVIGVADNLRGEVPKAFVVLKEGSGLKEEDLRYFCREHLAHFKIPHYFEFVTSLPKNRVGKIDKESLRKT